MSVFKELEQHLQVRFKKGGLVEQAFIHRSVINESSEQKKMESNERLEFLGDAVLELVVTEYLYKNHPNPEGELTNWRAALVRGEHLAEIARRLDLGKYLRLSRGEELSGGRTKDYILANTFEALIGVIYLEKGFAGAEKAIHKVVIPALSSILAEQKHIDAKSHLQEVSQEKKGITPTYDIITAEGPDHAKIFTIGAYIGKEKVGEGQGPSKQKAEQDAARHALEKLGWKTGPKSACKKRSK